MSSTEAMMVTPKSGSACTSNARPRRKAVLLISATSERRERNFMADWFLLRDQYPASFGKLHATDESPGRAGKVITAQTATARRCSSATQLEPVGRLRRSARA